MKEIKNFKGYLVDKNGNIYSNKSGKIKLLKPFLDSKKRYFLIKLKNDEGIRKALLVHRIVAITFIPNPYSLPVVDHINDNTKDNRVENLQWLSYKDNVNKEYKNVGPKRFKIRCAVYFKGQLLKTFEDIKAACEYMAFNYKISFSSLYKYKKAGEAVIKTINEDKYPQKTINYSYKKRVNKNTILLFKNDEIIYKCKTFKELKNFLFKNLKIDKSESVLRDYYYRNQIYLLGYLIKRPS